jgi:hypothetical protein
MKKHPLSLAVAAALALAPSACDKKVAAEAEFEVPARIGGAAVLWKNGEARRLSDGREAQALSVFASGQDLYVAGYEAGADGAGVATLWKNFGPQRLSDGSGDVRANSVFVSGGDVYVSRTGEATICKNGFTQRLGGAADAGEARSVFVSGRDVYVAGYEGLCATLWKTLSLST